MLTAPTWALALLSLSGGILAQEQKREDGYFGYKLSQRGDDEESARYGTANTDTAKNITDLNPIPDVYLNASVSVGLISVEVDNITAKVNLDAKVLNLLHFRAGVDAKIDRVKLKIENVSAEVELEARLENVVVMVGDVLNSIDLNPTIATLGQDLGGVVGDITDGPGGGNGGDGNGNGGSGSGSGNGGNGDGETGNGEGNSNNAKRDFNNFKMDSNILFSVHNFSGQKHRNRKLAQNGDIIDVRLNNQGNKSGQKKVGYYANDMTFTGHNRTIEDGDGQVIEFELQYVYSPYTGLEVTSNIYTDTKGEVIRTQVIAESEGGGTGTIQNNNSN